MEKHVVGITLKALTAIGLLAMTAYPVSAQGGTQGFSCKMGQACPNDNFCFSNGGATWDGCTVNCYNSYGSLVGQAFCS